MELRFNYEDILKILWGLSAENPVFFFNFVPECGERIRKALHMEFNQVVGNKQCDDSKHPYFDPKATLERQRQVVIILGEVS